MFRKIIHFFDKLEDGVRGKLSRFPILYAFLGGAGIVLFWKGVWETAEIFPFLFGPGSILLSMIILLTIGIFVSSFIGNEILISGLKSQRKIAEKTEEEIRLEEGEIAKIYKRTKKIEKDIEELKELIQKHNKSQ